MMKVILLKWNSICEIGILNALRRMGIECIVFERGFSSVDYDKSYLQDLAGVIDANPDAVCVMGINFQPVVARCCKIYNLPYLSWTVDCPSFQLYSDTVKYPTNRIFLFDRMQYLKFVSKNPDCVFHLPLGCDLATWDSIRVTEEDEVNYGCDVSFVGSLYSEKCMYNEIAEDLPDRVRGFAEGVIAAQMNVYGYNFIEDCLTDEWALEFKKYADWNPLAEDYEEDIKGIISDTYLGTKCTEEERIRTFNAISEHFSMDLWTLSDTSRLPRVNNRGGADSDTMMPKIIKCSKVNINMTNRPIKTGLPLRIFDLVGAGGFVISNYQSEIPEMFVPGEEIVLFESIPDLLEKIGYYLKHDDERRIIAKNGHDKVRDYYTYDHRLNTMFKVAGII